MHDNFALAVTCMPGIKSSHLAGDSAKFNNSNREYIMGKWTSLKAAGTGTGTGTETRGLRVRMRSMKHALDLGCKHGWIRTRYDSHIRQ